MTTQTITIDRSTWSFNRGLETYTIQAPADIYGPFGVWHHTDGREGHQWEVIHVATGLGVTNGHRNVSTARRVARALMAQPGWDFLTEAEFAPRHDELKLQVQAAVTAAERRRGMGK